MGNYAENAIQKIPDIETMNEMAVVSWGGYEYFSERADKISKDIKISYICGKKEYVTAGGYEVITREELLSLENPFVIISLAKQIDIRAAANWLRENGIPFTHLALLLGTENISYGLINAMGGSCADINNNIYSVSERIEANVIINPVSAVNAKVQIGEIQVQERLFITLMGDGGRIEIGDGTTFLKDCSMLVNTDGMIEIGQECMFSHHVRMTQPDQHFIFDALTGERTNNPKPIRVGNHVWVGREAKLLGGAEIGDNSVVGGYAVTSGKFPSNVVLAGSPAKIIREGIIWARDKEEIRGVKNIRDCKDQTALKYMNDLPKGE